MVSHRRPPHPHPWAGRALAARVSVLTATATATVAAMAAVPVLASPGQPPSRESPPADSAEAAVEVDRLFVRAERAVEAFNGISERVEELQDEVERRQDLVAQGQQAVNDQRHMLGSAAAAQYRNGGIDPSLALMLSTDPDGYLDRAATLDRVGDRQAGILRKLFAAQRVLQLRREETVKALAELTDEEARLSRAKRTAQRRLADARRRYDRLVAQERLEREREREAREAREERERAARRAQSVITPQPEPLIHPPSSRAATAVAAARQALGAPYAWGQAGPDAFDCSGFVQWSYAQAGVALPRTSQEQAAAGRSVSLDQAQPGDIVVYRSDASHVGMYVGDGQILHAPRPGSHVRYDAVGIMPVSSVVRP